MIKYNIRKLITRGEAHHLRCEDDLLVIEKGDYILMNVFDGCSSGKDSHLASTMYKNIVNKVINTPMWNSFIYEEELKEYRSDFNFLCSIIQKFRNELEGYIETYNVNTNDELLSTAVFCLFNKISQKCNIIFCGDGVCSIDDDVYAPHDENGDSVYYLSTVPVKEDLFKQYIINNCFYVINRDVNKELSISTDGIDSFKDIYGINKSNEARDLFFKSERFLHQEIMLMRLYNIFTKNNTPCKNQDDFTMIRLNIEKDEPTIEVKEALEELPNICEIPLQECKMD